LLCFGFMQQLIPLAEFHATSSPCSLAWSMLPSSLRALLPFHHEEGRGYDAR